SVRGDLDPPIERDVAFFWQHQASSSEPRPLRQDPPANNQCPRRARAEQPPARSEEHTSELQSLTNIVCRLLLEKKKQRTTPDAPTTTRGRAPPPRRRLVGYTTR